MKSFRIQFTREFRHVERQLDLVPGYAAGEHTALTWYTQISRTAITIPHPTLQGRMIDREDPHKIEVDLTLGDTPVDPADLKPVTWWNSAPMTVELHGAVTVVQKFGQHTHLHATWNVDPYKYVDVRAFGLVALIGPPPDPPDPPARLTLTPGHVYTVDVRNEIIF